MANAHAFDALDQFGEELMSGFEFDIPSTEGAGGRNSRQERLGKLRWRCFVWMMANDKITPPTHWTRRFVRDLYLGTSGFEKSAVTDVQQILASREVGPVYRLMIGRLAALLGSSWGAAFAGGAFIDTDGSDRLTIREFREDIRLLCDERYLPGQLVRSIAAELRESSEPDFWKLPESIPVFLGRKKLVGGIKLLRESRGDPLDEALPKALEQWWDEGLHDLIEQQLKSLYMTLKPPAKREPT
jgi:hypothetical protein